MNIRCLLSALLVISALLLPTVAIAQGATPVPAELWPQVERNVRNWDKTRQYMHAYELEPRVRRDDAASPISVWEGPVSIGDRSLQVHCVGAMPPVILFLNGYGGSAGDWDGVQESLQPTPSCSYDRAGIAGSDPAPREPADAASVSADIHALIVALAGDSPVILVGFSLGGLFARYHAGMFPGDVDGLVLVDPTPPIWPALKLCEVSGRTRLELLALLSGLDPNEPERLDVLRIGAEVIAVAYPQVPVIMVTSGIKSLDPGFYGDWLHQVLTRLQEEQARELNASHMVASGCSHQFLLDCQDEVVDAILMAFV